MGSDWQRCARYHVIPNPRTDTMRGAGIGCGGAAMWLGLTISVLGQVGIAPVTPNSAGSRKNATLVLPEKHYAKIPLTALPESFSPDMLDDHNRVAGFHFMPGNDPAQQQVFGAIWQNGTITDLGQRYFSKEERGQTRVALI